MERYFEIPARLMTTLRLLGPLSEEVAAGYLYCVKAVLDLNDSVLGFVIEQRLAEKGEAPAHGKGLVFQVPIKPDSRAEATFIFTETLAAALAFMARPVAEEN